jgi:hypothetical protein
MKVAAEQLLKVQKEASAEFQRKLDAEFALMRQRETL